MSDKLSDDRLEHLIDFTSASNSDANSILCELKSLRAKCERYERENKILTEYAERLFNFCQHHSGCSAYIPSDGKCTCGIEELGAEFRAFMNARTALESEEK